MSYSTTFNIWTVVIVSNSIYCVFRWTGQLVWYWRCYAPASLIVIDIYFYKVVAQDFSSWHPTGWSVWDQSCYTPASLIVVDIWVYSIEGFAPWHPTGEPVSDWSCYTLASLMVIDIWLYTVQCFASWHPIGWSVRLKFLYTGGQPDGSGYLSL